MRACKCVCWESRGAEERRERSASLFCPHSQITAQEKVRACLMREPKPHPPIANHASPPSIKRQVMPGCLVARGEAACVRGAGVRGVWI